MSKLINELGGLGFTLELKEPEVAEMFDTYELQAYFKVRDSIKLLIDNLFLLEQALYRNKIAL